MFARGDDPVAAEDMIFYSFEQPKVTKVSDYLQPPYHISPDSLYSAACGDWCMGNR